MKQTASKSYALRIEAALVKPLQELKKQNRRSLNAEINAALEAWIERARVPGHESEASLIAPDRSPDRAVKGKPRLSGKKRSKSRGEAASTLPVEGPTAETTRDG
jgi:hypothetical protein